MKQSDKRKKWRTDDDEHHLWKRHSPVFFPEDTRPSDSANV